ncbi:MAG: flagellar export chaperone FlgN [Planctomycetota bacterium]
MLHFKPQLDALLDTVHALTERHTQLLKLMEAKQDMMRTADGPGLADLTRRENAIVQAVSELEKRRITQAGELTLRLDPTAAEPLRLAELAELLPEPHRGQLLVRRQELVAVMQDVRRRASVARRASESLLKHMTGLLHTVTNAASGSGTYGRRGPAPSPAAPLRSINLTA